ncbi:MAG TPA: NPCBM/NEW2 domain-containing protein, partial [Pirellulales bacterium]
MHSIFKLLILSLGAALAWPPAARADARFLVAYVDGQHGAASAAEMPWMAGDAKLPETGAVRLNGKPVRWIRDPQQPPVAPGGPAIELFGGDVLPAKVLAYEKGAESAGGSEAARSYLLVEPLADEMADKPPAVRVGTAWIKRVVWEPRRGGRYEPGSVFYRDGRQTSFRAARWTEGGVRLLEEQGTVLVTFDQIAELHFPLADPWSTYVGQLAILSPDAAAWLLQVETAAGLKATASTTRSRFLHPPAAGGTGLLLQPAWCLDPLVVPCSGTSGWTFFAPDEVPLSSLVPRRAVQRAMLGAGWPQFAVDANVQGGPLRSGGEQFGWGFGVHAYSQLEFDLPPFARSFSVSLGLDETAGSGGCVQATVAVT